MQELAWYSQTGFYWKKYGWLIQLISLQKELILTRGCCATRFLSPPHISSCLRQRRSACRCCCDCRWHWHWPSHTGLPPVWHQSSSVSSGSTGTWKYPPTSALLKSADFPSDEWYDGVSFPMRLYLQTFCTTLLVSLWPGQARWQRSLRQQQYLRPLAQHVQACFIVHVTLVGIPLFTEQERPVGCRQWRRD